MTREKSWKCDTAQCLPGTDRLAADRRTETPRGWLYRARASPGCEAAWRAGRAEARESRLAPVVARLKKECLFLNSLHHSRAPGLYIRETCWAMTREKSWKCDTSQCLPGTDRLAADWRTDPPWLALLSGCWVYGLGSARSSRRHRAPRSGSPPLALVASLLQPGQSADGR